MTATLAVIGGGRWGQVTLSVIANMQTPFDKVVAVSAVNAAEVANKIAILNQQSSIPFSRENTLSDLFAKYNVKAAVIANACAHHFETAMQLIQKGVHVLIEKPIVTSSQQMQALIEEAHAHHVVIVPGLSYRFCSYLQHFSLHADKKGWPHSFILRWSDASQEMRYGQVKKHDSSISVVQDVMSHVWTILSMLFPGQPIHVKQNEQDHHQARLTVSIHHLHGTVELQREADKRERYLAFYYPNDHLVLDFSHEPGILQLNGETLSGDPNWANTLSPLTRQLAYFFSILQQGQSNQADLQACLDSVACTELALQFA